MSTPNNFVSNKKHPKHSNITGLSCSLDSKSHFPLLVSNTASASRSWSVECVKAGQWNRVQRPVPCGVKFCDLPLQALKCVNRWRQESVQGFSESNLASALKVEEGGSYCFLFCCVMDGGNFPRFPSIISTLLLHQHHSLMALLRTGIVLVIRLCPRNESICSKTSDILAPWPI